MSNGRTDGLLLMKNIGTEQKKPNVTSSGVQFAENDVVPSGTMNEKIPFTLVVSLTEKAVLKSCAIHNPV